MCKCTFGKENMTLENKLNITDSTELARMEEKISKKKAVELFENGYLDNYKAVANAEAEFQIFIRNEFCNWEYYLAS